METKKSFFSHHYHIVSVLSWAAAIAAAAVLALLMQVKLAGALACDANAVGTNVMVGCVWRDNNGNGVRDAGDTLVGPARQNPPSVKSSPGNMGHYQALGWWGFSYHHYGCCANWTGLYPCYPNSCDLVGSHPLAVSGVAGWGFQDAIPKSIGIWKGNFTFDNATYVFRVSGDFSHPRRLYIDDQLVGGESGSVFLEKQMTPGTHQLKVEYSQDNDASLGFTIFIMAPSLAVSPTTTSVAVGQTAVFTASLDPDGNSGNFDNPHYVSKPPQNVTATAEWTSSDPAVASVTSAGQVKGLKAGTVTITAKYPLPAPSWTNNNGLETYNGIRASAQLTVTVPPDPTAPTVSVTAPTAGATVSGTVTVSAAATDNVGVVGVQFKVDGANVGAEDDSAPYSVSWNTSSYSNASHSITAVVRDAAGNTRTSTAVAVTVNNSGGGGGGTCSGNNCGACTQSACLNTPACSWNGSACVLRTDTTAPTVSITAPAAGATVSGTVTVSAAATDNVAVVGVQFKADGANIGAEDTSSPYSVSWNTATYSNASHSITAVARDAAGNTKTSAAVTVTVNNANPPPTCSGNNCGACTTLATCTNNTNCEWTGTTCVAKTAPVCSGSNCGACTTQASCPSSACSWNGSACVSVGNPPPECTNFTGYASNCDSNGTKILRLTQSSASQTNIAVSITLPASPVNVIYNTGYYWSPTRNQWVSFTLTGTAYSSATTWLKDSASANLNIPRSDLQTGANYILTWDYIKNGTCWVGPAGTCGTGKWRIAVFNIQ